MKILCIGSVNIDHIYTLDDFVKEKETKTCDSYLKLPGGKGLNQSIALAKSGSNVTMLCAVSKDGLWLVNVLKENAINPKFKLVDLPTGHAIIEVAKNNNRILVYPGANYAITKEFIKESLDEFNGDIVVLQNEISNVDYAIDYASNLGFKVVLNASPLNNIDKLNLSKIDLLVVNEVEAAYFVKEYSDFEDLVFKLHQQYNCKVLLTVGEKGSYFYDSTIYYQNAYKAEVVDTTGAGDTFLGFFVSTYYETKDPVYALKLASKASSIAIGKKGSYSPSIKEVINELEL